MSFSITLFPAYTKKRSKTHANLYANAFSLSRRIHFYSFCHFRFFIFMLIAHNCIQFVKFKPKHLCTLSFIVCLCNFFCKKHRTKAHFYQILLFFFVFSNTLVSKGASIWYLPHISMQKSLHLRKIACIFFCILCTECIFAEKRLRRAKHCALPAAAGKEYFGMAARISPCQSFGTPYPMQEDISKLCKSKLSVLCIRRDHRSERNYFAVYTPSRR